MGSQKIWRTGVTKEARSSACDFAFSHLNIEEIYAGAWEDNLSSCRSMESYGFKLFSSKKFSPKHGKELTMDYYRLEKGKLK